MLLGTWALVDWSLPSVTPLIVESLLQAYNQLNEFLIYHLEDHWDVLLAPASWFLALVALCIRPWIYNPSPTSVEDEPHVSRRDRRFQDQTFAKSLCASRNQPDSICTRGLHKSYPRRLRQSVLVPSSRVLPKVFRSKVKDMCSGQHWTSAECFVISSFQPSTCLGLESDS
jgi:hypothetical protein